jgi:hypothetical protein
MKYTRPKGFSFYEAASPEFKLALDQGFRKTNLGSMTARTGNQC